MTVSPNLVAMVGAGLLGVVCAATFYVVEHFRQDRRRHTLATDLARLDLEVTGLRKELDDLLAQQRKKGTKRVRRSKKAASIVSSTLTEDYTSALGDDSSDLEFFDVSDEEADVLDLEQVFATMDPVFDEANATELESCLERLQNLCIEFPSNPELLWRIGKVHNKLYEKTDILDHLNKGIVACSSALDLNPKSAESHKWIAICYGARSKSQPTKEKTLDGLRFKEHLDKSLAINPNDGTLHHMAGHFLYEIASLKWYERKVAEALFAELPNATFDQALESFQQAERLSDFEWKENYLSLAKTKIKLGKIDDAIKDIRKAEALQDNNQMDDRTDLEVKELLKKYCQ